jgi:hypothetical protein
VLADLTSPHQDLLVRAERRRQKFFNDFSRACARTLRGSLWAGAAVAGQAFNSRRSSAGSNFECCRLYGSNV